MSDTAVTAACGAGRDLSRKSLVRGLSVGVSSVPLAWLASVMLTFGCRFWRQEEWLPHLQHCVECINETFSRSFATIGCAGEVALHEADDYDQFAIHIRRVDAPCRPCYALPNRPTNLSHCAFTPGVGIITCSWPDCDCMLIRSSTLHHLWETPRQRDM